MKALLNSLLDSRNHTIEREQQHREKEMNKTLFGYYSNHADSIAFGNNIELLRATIGHVNQEHIEAFFKTSNGKFIIVLSSTDHKGIMNFREHIRNETVNFRILHEPPNRNRPSRQHTKGSKYDPDTIFVTMFLPTAISNAAVKKAFMEFGHVHTVFAGRYKEEEFQDICNGKRHIRLTHLIQNTTSPIKFNLVRIKDFFM